MKKISVQILFYNFLKLAKENRSLLTKINLFGDVEKEDLVEYTTIFDGELEVQDTDNDSICDQIYELSNTTNFFKNRSMCVGDIIKFDDKVFVCSTMGFKDLTESLIA